MNKLTICLWFDNQAEEAAQFYKTVFKDFKMGSIARYTAETPSDKPLGSVLIVNFEINQTKFMALNGGPHFKLSEAISFVISCKDQDEIDYYWEKLSAVPESEQCGWVKDKFGVSWQIVPSNMEKIMTNDKNGNKMKAMLQMKKLDIAKLESA